MLTANKPSLNIDKTNFIILHPRQKVVNPLVTASVNKIQFLHELYLQKMQHFQINKESISEWAILSANNLFKCLHRIQLQAL